jgi:hypothetical protein
LEESDLDGLVFVPEHTRSLTKDFGGANARTTRAENVGCEDRFGSGGDFAGGYFFDESGNVDTRGAGVNAWCIIAIEAALRLSESGLVAEWGVNLLH